MSRRPPRATRGSSSAASDVEKRQVYDRFRKWRDDGTFEAVLSRLQLKLREDGLMDLDTWMIDATSVRATRAAAGGGKKGARKNR